MQISKRILTADLDIVLRVCTNNYMKLITKTRLFKYIENISTKKKKKQKKKNWKFSYKNSDIFHISPQNIGCE